MTKHRLVFEFKTSESKHGFLNAVLNEIDAAAAPGRPGYKVTWNDASEPLEAEALHVFWCDTAEVHSG